MTTINRRGSAGWFFLAAAMILPGFLIYNWWNHQNEETRRAMSQKVRKRLPEGSGIFAGAPEKDKLTNPIAAKSTGGVAISSATHPLPGLAAIPAKPAAATPVAPAPIAVQAPSAGPIPPAAAVIASPVPAAQTNAPVSPWQGVAESTAVFISRDPMLSPHEIERLKQIAKEEYERNQPKKPIHMPKPKPVNIERTVSLQGIITVPDAPNKAIVNGLMVSEGQMVGRVKVVKITAQEVTFAFKTKRFTKKLGK